MPHNAVAEPTAPSLLVTFDQAAEMLGLSRKSVARLALAGRLPMVKVGRSARIPRVALQQLIDDLLTVQNESPGTEPRLSSKPAGQGRDACSV